MKTASEKLVKERDEMLTAMAVFGAHAAIECGNPEEGINILQAVAEATGTIAVAVKVALDFPPAATAEDYARLLGKLQ